MSTTVRSTTNTGVTNSYYTTTATEAISTDQEPTSFSAPIIIFITQVMATASGSIVVTWSRVNGASGYEVRYYNEIGNLDGLKSDAHSILTRIASSPGPSQLFNAEKPQG